MTGKVAIVTGGSSGLGKYIAKELVEAGVNVVITGRNEQRLNEVERELNQSDKSIGEAFAIAMDVSRTDQINKTISTVMDKWDRIDILINNAGVREETSIEEITEEEWNTILSINLTGTFFFSQGVVGIMKKQNWGRIINVSSYGGQVGPLTSGAHYCASKAGQLALTKSFARTYAQNGITVNSITPAAVHTPEMDKISPEKLEAMKASIPVKRFGKSEEVGKLVSYLVSEDSGYITGATFDINGGLLMR